MNNIDEIKKIAKISAAILFLGLCASSCTIISTSEVGIKSRFGIITSQTPLTEGVHWKLPILDNIQKISLKQHQETFKIDHTQTKDLQPVSITYKVVYSIPESKVIYNRTSLNGDIFEVLITPRANESIMSALAEYAAEDLISNRDKVIKRVKEKLAERVIEHARIDDISITEFDFEKEEFEQAVQRKVVAKQDAQAAEIKKQQSQAEADQTLIKARAEATAIKIRSEALAGNQKLVDLTIAEKRNGVSPTTVITNGGNGGNIIFPLKSN